MNLSWRTLQDGHVAYNRQHVGSDRAASPHQPYQGTRRARHGPWRRKDVVRALRRRNVPHARRLALSGVRLQDRLLRVVKVVISRWSLVIGHWSLVIGRWLVIRR